MTSELLIEHLVKWQIYLNVGTRVQLRTHVDGPPCRTGSIETVDIDRSGYLVRHDSGELFGWGHSEVERLLKTL